MFLMAICPFGRQGSEVFSTALLNNPQCKCSKNSTSGRGCPSK